MPRIILKNRKPRPDFPLFPHATGRWAKKVRGKTEYFGKIEDDPKGERALAEWLDQKDLLLAGRRRQVSTGALSVLDLAEKVMSWKHAQSVAGDISYLTLREWHRYCKAVVEHFGRKCAVEDVGPDDFLSLAQTRSHRALSHRRKFIIYVRSLFNFAYCDEQRLISKPVTFGQGFRIPKLLPKGANDQTRVFTAEELRKFISRSRRAMRAIVLLGINCGFGNYDCATLTFGNLDLKAGWHTHPRPKTGVKRRCPLWNETISAIQDWLKVRPRPADPSHSDLVFLTMKGNPFVRPSPKTKNDLSAGKLDDLQCWDAIRTNACHTLRALGIKRPGLSFYSLRHTFRTIGDGEDPVAIDLIMGHKTPGMGTHYRDTNYLDDERLRAVTDRVHTWLFPQARANLDLEDFARQVLETKGE